MMSDSPIHLVPSDPPAPSAEEARIREAYARREDRGRYTWFHPGYLLMMQALERDILALLKRDGLGDLSGAKILEIGCGTGQWLMACVKWGARPENLTGIDLLPDRIAEAGRRCPPAIQLRCGSAAPLDAPDQTFDWVFQMTVFTSILDAGMKRQIAAEMCRVLKPEGRILWYDYCVNNPMNPDVRGVPKREIRALFPHCTLSLRRVTLLPPLTRALAPRAAWLCHGLSRLKILNTHYLGLIRKG
jgi:SAM-dependent methyltransferase